MGLVESLIQLVTGGPETKTTKTDQFLPGNDSSGQQIHDFYNEVASQTENNRFKRAIELVRQRIQLMYTSLLEKSGVTDLSRQFRFLLAFQVIMYDLSSQVIMSNIRIDSRVVNGVESRLKRIRIGKKNLTVKATTSLPATLKENTVYLVYKESAGRDNTHFAIEVYFKDKKEPIHTEFRISPDQQDKRLEKRIANAVERFIENLNNSPGLAGTEPKTADNSGKNKSNRQNRGRK